MSCPSRRVRQPIRTPGGRASHSGERHGPCGSPSDLVDDARHVPEDTRRPDLRSPCPRRRTPPHRGRWRFHGSRSLPPSNLPPRGGSARLPRPPPRARPGHDLAQVAAHLRVVPLRRSASRDSCRPPAGRQGVSRRCREARRSPSTSPPRLPPPPAARRSPRRCPASPGTARPRTPAASPSAGRCRSRSRRPRSPRPCPRGSGRTSRALPRSTPGTPPTRRRRRAPAPRRLRRSSPPSPHGAAWTLRRRPDQVPPEDVRRRGRRSSSTCSQDRIGELRPRRVEARVRPAADTSAAPPRCPAAARSSGTSPPRLRRSPAGGPPRRSGSDAPAVLPLLEDHQRCGRRVGVDARSRCRRSPRRCPRGSDRTSRTGVAGTVYSA